MDKVLKIVEGQKEFQKMVDFPIDSILEKDRNEISEKYIFKLIEEAVELRKEFPSVINPYSKSQKNADLNRVKEELSDVILFLINIINVWKFSADELIETLTKVQSNNFNKVKAKKMAVLNSDILKVPSKVSGVGQGNLTPKYVFIGQNPGKDITQGYKFWSNSEDGSSKILLPILDKLGVTNDCYFTNVVKCVTPDNEEPSEEMTKFYLEFLERELEILRYNNPDMKIISMGSWTEKALGWVPNTKIWHPASLLYGTNKVEDYEDQVKIALE